MTSTREDVHDTYIGECLIKPYLLHQTSPCWSLNVSIYFILFNIEQCLIKPNEFFQTTSICSFRSLNVV